MLSVIGTALLINDDNTVTVLEDVEAEKFDVLKEEELTDKVNPAVSVIFCEDAIDWEYGY